ncbi:acyl-CoA dehydrogenase family protein [Microbulbifer agarilyticus]|uniref:Acyl-CoA dehydrogenase n=1 Tax=Microbulbifer agarilyticus TaxID=260552 RepID=A0A1Q2M5D2_9GAMM|nr:acyl-CoA dehydrogenase family protein [Microbulbifer agarilyticus]AQQ67891.1 acyl-CoA dehydrogenase [Microbulbifer agarilyticus]MBY6210849.1 acyl-CoA dehydrogenase family protein [Microbulbifer agarilyticus]
MSWSAEDEAAILDTIDKFVANDVAPIAREKDLADEYPHELVETMKELGLFGATIGEEFGGLSLSASTYARIVQKISAAWMAPGGIFNSHLIMAAAIERFGTEEQKQQYLPLMAEGTLRGGIALTEPNAGTDLQSIRCVARRDGDEYVVNGSKMWITNALNGNCLALLVKTDPDAEPRHRGMSMLIIRTKDDEGNLLPGITINKIKKTCYRAIDTAEVVFEDFRVSIDQLVGGEEGRGFHIAVGGLELGRINVAARGAGIAQGALKLALRYAQERETFGKPIIKHQAIQLKLGEMAAKVEAAKLLVDQAARMYDSGQRCDLEAGMAKYFASEAGVFCSQEAMRIFGGYGFSTEYEIERYYRDAMLMCVGEGTNEMQRIIIAKQLAAREAI